MTAPTTGDLATSRLPPSDIVEKAIQKCFDSYFTSGEWIDAISDPDRIDLLKQMWEISKAPRDSDGVAYTAEHRDIDMRALLDRQAYIVCEALAQTNWMMFV